MGNAGTIVGQPHPEGGEKFLLDTGQIIETEGKEVVIPQELLESKKIYSFRGTNKKILGRILQLVGTSLKSEVTDIRYGDVIICMRSAEDKTVRILSGTIEEILDQVNQSNGCKPIIQPIGSRQLAVGNEQPMMAKNGMRIPFRQKLKDWQIENPNSPRWQKKKERIRELSNTIHRLRLNVSKDLQSDDEKLFLTTLVIAIMDKTAERIGNDDSADNGHFGVTGFQKKHVDIIGKRIHFNYTGKTGMKQDKDFSDERIAKALKRAIKNSPSKFIFETSDGFRIKADKANRYLEQFKITAKDIRGYLANKWMIAKLEVGNRQSAVGNEQPEKAKKERKKIFNKALSQTAGEVGHGKGTLKKHYLIPELQTEFVENGNIIDMKNLGYYHDGGIAGQKIKSNFTSMKSEKQISAEIISDTQAQLRKLGVNEEEIKKLSQPDSRGLYDKLFQKVFDLVNEKYHEGGKAGIPSIRIGITYINKANFNSKRKLLWKTGNRYIGITAGPSGGWSVGSYHKEWLEKYFSEGKWETAKPHSETLQEATTFSWAEKAIGIYATMLNGTKREEVIKKEFSNTTFGSKAKEETIKILDAIIDEIEHPKEMLEEGGIAGENSGFGLGNVHELTSNEEYSCFHSYLLENCPGLCEKLMEENINENPELRNEMNEAHEKFTNGGRIEDNKVIIALTKPAWKYELAQLGIKEDQVQDILKAKATDGKFSDYVDEKNFVLPNAPIKTIVRLKNNSEGPQTYPLTYFIIQKDGSIKKVSGYIRNYKYPEEINFIDIDSKEALKKYYASSEKELSFENAVEQYHKAHPADSRTDYDSYVWFKGSNAVIVKSNISRRTILPKNRKQIFTVNKEGKLSEGRDIYM